VSRTPLSARHHDVALGLPLVARREIELDLLERVLDDTAEHLLAVADLLVQRLSRVAQTCGQNPRSELFRSAFAQDGERFRIDELSTDERLGHDSSLRVESLLTGLPIVLMPPTMMTTRRASLVP